MGIRLKLILSFLLISLLGASLGAIAIWSNQQLIKQLAFKEKPTRFAIHTANRIGTQAKWAERSFYQYLTLNNRSERNRFFQHMADVDEQIEFLENSLNHVEGEALFKTVKLQRDLLLSRGSELIELFDQAKKAKINFPTENYQDQIFDIHDVTNHLRTAAAKLTNFLTDLLNRQIEHTAANYVGYHAEEAEAHLMLYLLLDDPMSKGLFFTDVKSINEQISVLERHAQSVEGKQVVIDMASKKKELVDAGKLLIKRYGQQKQANVEFSPLQYQNEIHSFHIAASGLRSFGDKLGKIQNRLERKPRKSMLQKAEVFNFTAFTIISGVFVLAIVLGFWLAIGLSSSSKRLQLAAKQVGQGNLDVQVNIKSDDEMGVLAATFNQMISDLKQTHLRLDERNKVLNQEIVKRKKIEKELQEQATTDSLTGILNRRAFFEKAQKEQLRTSRYKRKMSVLMMDLDCFKSINDNYGHRGGDEILKLFAKEAEKPLRTSDLIGRIGGEEFAVVLPETDLNRAVKIAERIRLRIQEIIVPIGQLEVHFTVSIGASEIVMGEQDINLALNRADKALYQAKKLGRNRVCSESKDDIIAHSKFA